MKLEMKTPSELLPRSVAWLSRHYLGGLTILALLIYMFTYLEGSFIRPIRADGEGYYANLPSYVIYGDPSLEQNAIAQYDGEYPRWTFIRRQPETGRFMNTYNLGVSLLMLPFFLVAHGLTWAMQSMVATPGVYAFNHPLNGYSFFYQHGAGLAGLVYFLLAIAILKRTLERQFGRSATLFALTCVVFGTNLLNYGTGETVHAHASTLFLVSCLLWLVPLWHADPASRRKSLALGIVCGLLYLTRPLNVLFFALWPLYGLQSWSEVRARPAFFWRHRASLAWAGLALLVLLIPQFMAWKYATGRFLVNAYQGYYGWVWPRLGTFLFSIYKGMFFWFPATALAAVGFLPLFRQSRAWFWTILGTTALFVVTVSSYYKWTAAGGFGNRYIVDLTLLLAFPLAALWDGLKKPAVRLLVLALAAGGIAWTLFLMKLYYTREISFYGLDGSAVFDIFWVRKEHWLSLFR